MSKTEAGKPIIVRKDGRKRDPDESRSKFERWVLENGGTKQISLLIGVDQMTVVNWCYKRRTPYLWAAKKLVEISNGELTYDDILQGTTAESGVKNVNH